jgi:hypothetical protein
VKKLRNQKLTDQTVADLSRICLNAPVRDGLTVDDIRNRIRLIDKLEAGKDKAEIDLEDQEARLLQSCVKQMRWGVVHEDIVAFADIVEEMMPCPVS